MSAYCILSAALSTASSFRIWNSSTGILSLPGASVRSSTHDKGHEEGGSAYAKAGSSLRSPPGNSRASTPQNQSLPTFCFVPWRAPSRSAQTFKKQKTYPPLSDLRPSPPPPFAPFRAQEFPTLPPKPLKVLPKPEEDKKFLNSGAFKTDCTICGACSLEKTPSGGSHPG